MSLRTENKILKQVFFFCLSLSVICTYEFLINAEEVDNQITSLLIELESGFETRDIEKVFSAAKGLTDIGPPASSTILEWLQNKNKPNELRCLFSELLGEIRNPEVSEGLISILEDTEESSIVKGCVTFTLGVFGDKTVSLTLIRQLNHPDENLRSITALTLGILKDSNAVDYLVLLLTDSSPLVRIRVIKALGMIGDTKAKDALIEILELDDELVNAFIVDSLGKIGGDEIIDILLDLLNSDKRLIKVNAIVALGKIGNKRATEPLLRILEGEDEFLMIYAAEALAEIGDQTATEPLLICLGKIEDSFTKMKVQEAYERLRMVDSIPPVTKDDYSYPGVWVNRDANITLTACDDLSGIDKTYYTINSSIPKEGNSILIAVEGEHLVEYWSMDKAGNVENRNSISVKIDKTPPEVTLMATPAILWPPNHTYVKVEISGSAIDNLSGIGTKVFEVSDEYNEVMPTITDFGEKIDLLSWRRGEDLDGRIYTIKVTVTDNTGNSSIKTTNVIVPHDMRDIK